VLCLLGRECAFDGWRLTQTDTILVLTHRKTWTHQSSTGKLDFTLRCTSVRDANVLRVAGKKS